MFETARIPSEQNGALLLFVTFQHGVNLRKQTQVISGMWLKELVQLALVYSFSTTLLQRIRRKFALHDACSAEKEEFRIVVSPPQAGFCDAHSSCESDGEVFT